MLYANVHNNNADLPSTAYLYQGNPVDVTADQLKDAAVHWALQLALGACHELASDTMYSALRDYHDQKRKEAVAAWHLTFNIDPDDDQDADRTRSAAAGHVTRL